MFERVKGWIGRRWNDRLEWRDPVTQHLRTKAAAIPRAGVRSRAAAERPAGELEAQLMELMRYVSIETTVRLYVGTNAQQTADAAWAAFVRAGGPFQTPRA